MKVTFDYDPWDWMHFARVLLRTSAFFRRQRRRGRVLAPVALLVLACLVALRSGFDNGFDDFCMAFLCALAAAWVVFFPRWYDQATLRGLLREMERGENLGLHGHREVELTPVGVRSISPAGEVFYNAETIRRVMVTRDALLLFVAGIHAVVFPRHRIDPDEFQEIVSFAKDHYTPAEEIKATGWGGMQPDEEAGHNSGLHDALETEEE